jgi:anthranilate phosphoribosyltransferase
LPSEKHLSLLGTIRASKLPTSMIQHALEKLLAGEDLPRAEAETAMLEILANQATPAQAVAFDTALWMKGPNTEELLGIEAARARRGARPLEACDPRVTHSELLDATTMLVCSQGSDLSVREAINAMEELLSGGASETQIATFLTALRFKGETVEEVVGFATAMRRHAPRIFADGHPVAEEALVDTCGTGGDALGTFNISTATAFVVAGAGVRVAKHGNRSSLSLCGSADVLEEFGVRIDLPPERVACAIEQVGIGFLFAPAMHSATRHVAKVRRELKIRTVFNLLGPLTNPAGASAQVVGVYDAGVAELMARALGELGVKRAFVVHGADGLDEISISGETHISELHDGAVQNYAVTPEDFGVRRAPLGAICGGHAKRNAAIIRGLLAGRSSRDHEPHREIVLANASAALVAAGHAADFRAGTRLAAESIDSGAALAKLDNLITFSQSAAHPASFAT